VVIVLERNGEAGRQCDIVRELAGNFVVYERFFAEPADRANAEERGQVAVSTERRGRSPRHGSSWSLSEMRTFEHFFHRRSLTFAALACVLSLLAFGHSLGFTIRMSPPSSAFAFQAIVLFVIVSAVCVHATVNLVRDVDRGYSPERCSLAAILLLFAFALATWVGIVLLQFIIHATKSG
jgi:hypothetical protein